MRRFSHLDLGAYALLAAGFGFRVAMSAHARFGGDEAHYFATSRAVATLRAFPALGPEITGSEARLPGPMYYWFMAIPEAFAASPRLGAAFVALGHVLAMLGLYRIAVKDGHPRAGFAAVLLFAFAPWDVLYADRIWGSCVVPIFASVALLGALSRSPRALVQGATVFAALVLPQLHLSSPVLWLAVLAIVLLRPPPAWSRRGLAAGAALAALAYLPYLVHELGHGFANTRAILARAGGNAEAVPAMVSIGETLVYGWLYPTAEIGYHFARGYWGGGYDEAAAYLTRAGLGRIVERHGVVAGGVFLSMALAALGWARGLAAVPGELARRRATGGVSAPVAAAVASGVGFVGAAAMIAAAKKLHFPHYTNLLVPLVFLPVGYGLERVFAGRLRAVGAAAAAVVALTMALVTRQYYLEVDRANGTSGLTQMVARIFAEGREVRLDFRHFQNHYAFGVVAETMFGRPLPLSPNAALRLVVHNDAPRAEVPPVGGARVVSELFDGVWLEGTTRARPKPPGVVFRASEGWRAAVVVASSAGRSRRCGPTPSGPACSYGDEPWRRLAPEALRFGGEAEDVLFLHPVGGGRVKASFGALPRGGTAALRYGLTDESVAAQNPEPVRVRVFDGARVALDEPTPLRPGLVERRFAVTSTAVAIELSVGNDGARVFGFELDVYAPGETTEAGDRR